jgi:hypothetical protein
MKITLCGSIAFYDEMFRIKEQLEALGHEVKLPPHEVAGPDGKTMISAKEYYAIRKRESNHDGWILERKEQAIRRHMDKVEWSDAVLVVNPDKNDIKGYIGANTLIEMGVAFYLRKKIFLLNQVPEMQYKEEITGVSPTVLNGDLSKLKEDFR